MKEKILEMITRLGSVSFAELSKIDGFRENNNQCMYLEAFPTVILWMNISAEALGALNELKDVIYPKPCSYLVYLADGTTLNLPLVKAKSKRTMENYKTPHWLPVTFNLRGKS